MFVPGSLLFHCGGTRGRSSLTAPSPCLQGPGQEGSHRECCKTQTPQRQRTWGSLALAHPASPASQDLKLSHGQEPPPSTSLSHSPHLTSRPASSDDGTRKLGPSWDPMSLSTQSAENSSEAPPEKVPLRLAIQDPSHLASPQTCPQTAPTLSFPAGTFAAMTDHNSQAGQASATCCALCPPHPLPTPSGCPIVTHAPRALDTPTLDFLQVSMHTCPYWAVTHVCTHIHTHAHPHTSTHAPTGLRQARAH